ncbi:MAG: ATP-binding cassette domain-containing protein [Acidobacteria bacterium]|nr:ATP-binding cassette domain-containing protein [Acidobacteriota bacterium]
MIEASRVTKVYGGRRVVEEVSFSVARGEILGFLGPNGAGKTTTMRILTGFVPPTQGTARIAGFDILDQPVEAKRRLGYLPEHPPLYDEMIVRSFLEFVATIRGVLRARIRTQVDRALERCGLTNVSGRPIGLLSKGFRQRVGLAQAILHEPDVLILDEPTVGLDPSQIRDIRQLIKGFAGDHTVILSTHILAEVTMTCDRVLIINEGKIAAEDTLEALAARGQRTRRVAVRVARAGAEALRGLRAIPGVLNVVQEEGGEGAFVVESAGDRDVREEIARRSVEGGWGLHEMRPLTLSLEEIFIRIIQGEAS